MKTITAIIADDEPLLRHHLDRSLADLWSELEVVDMCGDGVQALEKNSPAPTRCGVSRYSHARIRWLSRR